LPNGSWYSDEDGTIVLPEGALTVVGSIGLSGTHLVNASVTVNAAAGTGAAGASVCQLSDASGVLASGNEDGQVSSIGLTAFATGNVSLSCNVWTAGGGSATDVSITALPVGGVN
jgi:hypothetical protein